MALFGSTFIECKFVHQLDHPVDIGGQGFTQDHVAIASRRTTRARCSLMFVTDNLTAGAIELRPTSGSTEFHGFAVFEHDKRIGTIALAPSPGKRGKTEGSVRWNFVESANAFVMSQAIALANGYAFSELGWDRVETRIMEGNESDWRAASISGMRKEGVLRQPTPKPTELLLARLATDPDVMSKEGFVAILNAGLPRKRVIGQGLIRNERGEYLLCQLTYKNEWDLPGGVIEVGESPATGLVRELEEELGATFEVHDLVTMNWLPPWRAWDDACLFVFDLGQIDSTAVDRMVLQKSEIANVHWCDLDAAREHATGATIELLTAYEAGTLTPYREAPTQPE